MSLFSLSNVNFDGSRNVTIMGKVYGPQAAAQLLSLADAAYSIVFLLFIVYWGRRVRGVADNIDEDVISMSDYSVSNEVTTGWQHLRDITGLGGHRWADAPQPGECYFQIIIR